jgi:hypothetical protein
MRRKVLAYLCAVALVPACGEDTPTAPSGMGTIAFRQIAPPSGSTIVVSSGNPPIGFIERGSGQLSIEMDVSSTRNTDFARLDVYLLSEDRPGSTCGHNLPDGPTWGPWIGRRVVNVTVSGFQTSLLPCVVNSIRAILHVAAGPRSFQFPPPETETLAVGTMPIVYQLRR